MLTVLYIQSIDDAEVQDLIAHIYQNNKAMMYERAFSILKHHEDAQDAVHNTIISIHLHYNKFKDLSDSDMIPLISIYTRNEAIDIYNANNKRNGNTSYYPPDSEELDYEPIEDLDLVEIVTEKERRAVLIKAVGVLGTVQKDPLILKYFYNYSYEEISQVLHLTTGQVQYRLSTGKTQLRRLINKFSKEKI